MQFQNQWGYIKNSYHDAQWGLFILASVLILLPCSNVLAQEKGSDSASSFLEIQYY